MLTDVFLSNCLTIINHWIIYTFFSFSRLRQEEHGGCDRSAENAHSSREPDPTFIFCTGPFLLCSCYVFFLWSFKFGNPVITTFHRKVSLKSIRDESFTKMGLRKCFFFCFFLRNYTGMFNFDFLKIFLNKPCFFSNIGIDAFFFFRFLLFHKFYFSHRQLFFK